MRQRRIERRDHRGRGPLLRTEHRTRAQRPAERVRDIARHTERAARQFRQRLRAIDPVKLRQTFTAARNLLPLPVQQTEPERLKHPRAAIVRGAAANAHDETAASVRQRIPNHLPHAERRRVQRILLRARDERDAGGLRHLQNRRLADDAIDGIRRTSRRPRHRHRTQLAPQSGGQRFDSALSSVGERTHHAFRIRKRTLRPFGGGVPRLQRTETPLERIDGEYDLHCSPND